MPALSDLTRAAILALAAAAFFGAEIGLLASWWSGHRIFSSPAVQKTPRGAASYATALELIWTVVPAILLLGIAAATLLTAPHARSAL